MAEKHDLTNYLATLEAPVRVIYISSYIPRKCGIATFTKDLTTAINILNPEALAEIVAISDKENEYEYPWEAKYKIKQENIADYISCANYINQGSADVVVLEHEFGLFGGIDGEYILTLIDLINKPLITCFHSILPEPDEHKRYVMQRIIEKSAAAVAMSSISKKALIEQYNCPPNKTIVIQHGVYDFIFADTQDAKTRLNLNNDFMLMVSGLIGPGKGFEYVIEAMPKILQANPKAKLYIIGETHPGILQDGGGNYEDFLTKKINDLNIKDNVVMINRFLDLPELIEYFKAADVYVTPHLDPQQPASGTLAKAIGAGKVCISTPFNYAQEMLANEVGILVPFKDSDSIAKSVIEVMDNKTLYDKYRRNAYKLGKTMQWPRIAQRYLNLFKVVKENEAQKA